MQIILVKVGGSSITDKAKFETLNHEALTWFAETIKNSIHSSYLDLSQPDNDDGPSVIIVHGAGSFGHIQAKQNGLKGQSTAPSSEYTLNCRDKRKMMHGLSKVRTSVKKLNNSVTQQLVDAGINAVGLSPCINILGLQAHGGNENGGVDILVRTILEALNAGLCPIIHGDAGLYGSSSGILGGDTLVELITTHESLKDQIAKVIFLTDVEGVFTKDPRSHQDAHMINTISVTKEGSVHMKDRFTASGSSHEHDVTGGLEAKLASAINVAKQNIPVIIAKCCSSAGREYIRTKDPCSIQGGTIISLERENGVYE